ncbi:MAG: hypothetical protein RDU76_07365 [Candidatus Edwardsbacteria bacterium]|nr:hypothetical protein [Candidatus Edwardsbacteria bacterium]
MDTTQNDASALYSATDRDDTGNFQTKKINNGPCVNNLYWIDAAFGMPSIGIDFGLNYVTTKILYAGNFTRVAKFNNNEFWDGVDWECDTYSLLIGFYKAKENKFASLCTGVSYIVGLDRTEPEAYNPGTESVKFRTIGLPVKAQVSMHGKYIGIGIGGILNINKDMPYGLATLSLSFGKLKEL